MTVKTTGVVVKGPSGALHIEFSSDHAHNAEEVKTFLQANMGNEVEIVLGVKEELQSDSETRSTIEVKKLERENLSPCASPRYWKVRDDEDP